MTSVRSFDVFDTLVVRRVANPTDLFEICGEKLRARGLISDAPVVFARQRVAAESHARKLAPGMEPTFAEIYARLAEIYGWDDPRKESAAEVELAEESAVLVPVPGAAARVRRARAASPQILFLSDMYLPATFIESLLRRHGFFLDGDRLIVSNVVRVSKSSGEMFGRLRREFSSVRDWIHYGDNHHADHRMPKAAGIGAEILTDAHLSRWERMVRGDASHAPVWRSRLAGAMRLARLRSGEEPRSDLGRLGANVAGPILFGFIAWVLDQALRQGLQRLYFVARDGEIMLRIARTLCANWEIPIDCRYLYGSRQAWHSASVDRLGDSEKRWVLENDIPLSLAVVAGRLEVPAEAVAEAFSRRTGTTTNPNTLLSAEQLAELWLALQEAPLADMVRDCARKKRQQVMGYLEQEGFFDSVPWGMVDIGWRGNMQRSLEALLLLAGRPTSVRGFYFGLIEPAPTGFFSFWEETYGGGFPRERARLMEIFTAGTEGSTIGYAQDAEKFHPVLNRPRNTEAIEWGLEAFQRNVVEFVDMASEFLERKAIPPRDLGRITAEMFLAFCESPSRDEAWSLGRFPHAADQLETHFLRMLDPNLSFFQFARLAWHPRQWHRHPWIEGQLAIQPCWPVAAARKIRQRRRRRNSTRSASR